MQRSAISIWNSLTREAGKEAVAEMDMRNDIVGMMTLTNNNPDIGIAYVNKISDPADVAAEWVRLMAEREVTPQ